jgi:lycopene cyclase domain-containing protein
MYQYLLLLIVFVVVPNIILTYVNRRRLRARTLLLALVILFIIAIVWDQLSVRLGIWSFSQHEIVGSLLGLPVEEYLFFIFVPLLSINIYLLVERAWKSL